MHYYQLLPIIVYYYHFFPNIVHYCVSITQ